MNSINKTLYIPLYGKSYVSKRGLFITDKTAERIWEEEGFTLKGKSKSKWLAYYMGIRCAVFDEWLGGKMAENKNAVVIHIGCGLDNRVLRVGTNGHEWYDVDFPEVIEERKKYYTETEEYKMLCGDARDGAWLLNIEKGSSAIVVLEGVSMYLTKDEMRALTERLCTHFDRVALLVDCYTTLAAKMTKIKNPINDVGVTEVYGIDNPTEYESEGFSHVSAHDMTPQKYIDELQGFEKRIFRKLFAGGFSQKLYRLYEDEKR